MKKIFIFSDFPSEENPTRYFFIKHRVNILRKHYNVTVITLKYVRNTNKSFDIKKMDGYILVTLYVKQIKIPKLRVFHAEYQIKRLLNKYIRRDVPDLIHVHFSHHYSWIIYKVCKKNNIPYVITEHASFFETRIKRLYFGSKIKFAIEKAGKVVAVSSFLRKEMKKYIDREIDVVPNVVDMHRFNNIPRGENNNTKMITVGNFDEEDKKGYQLLFKAINKLNKNGYEFECDVIGNGPNKKKLEMQIEENGLSNVNLLGSISNELLPKYLSNADFFVSSSKKETFGVAIVEAMSCGLPIVSTKSGGPEDFLTKETGLFSEQTVDFMYQSLKQMLITYKNYNPILIRDMAINNFSEEVYYNNIKLIYDELL